MEDHTHEEDMDDVNLNDERERNWRMVFEENYSGVDDEKTLLDDKMWDIYANEKENLVKSSYLVEVFSHDGKEVLWGVVEYHDIKYSTDHDEI